MHQVCRAGHWVLLWETFFIIKPPVREAESHWQSLFQRMSRRYEGQTRFTASTSRQQRYQISVLGDGLRRRLRQTSKTIKVWVKPRSENLQSATTAVLPHANLLVQHASGEVFKIRPMKTINFGEVLEVRPMKIKKILAAKKIPVSSRVLRTNFGNLQQQ